MGVDFSLQSGKEDYSCRLYWITNLIDDYWQGEGFPPEFGFEKKLNVKEVKQLLNFLQACLPELEKDKQKQLARYDSDYFKKVTGINSSIKKLVGLVKSKPIDKSITPKFEGLLKRLNRFTETFSSNPEQEKAQIREDFDERISLVQKIIPLLIKIAAGRGSVIIG